MPSPKGLDSRLRGNDGLEVARNLKKNRNRTSRIPATFRHSRENGNLEPLNFQIIFEYCRCPKVWIPTTFRHSRENGNLEPQTFG
ncbi:hypothetical protein E0W31_01895 [Neisseria meningitidis]|nr:hypothetical protein [Neisseria meningitidis]MBJ7777721.1 hypothetical protein [Neisseria meningitidis]